MAVKIRTFRWIAIHVSQVRGAGDHVIKRETVTSGKYIIVARRNAERVIFSPILLLFIVDSCAAGTREGRRETGAKREDRLSRFRLKIPLLFTYALSLSLPSLFSAPANLTLCLCFLAALHSSHLPVPLSLSFRFALLQTVALWL